LQALTLESQAPELSKDAASSGVLKSQFFLRALAPAVNSLRPRQPIDVPATPSNLFLRHAAGQLRTHPIASYHLR